MEGVQRSAGERRQVARLAPGQQGQAGDEARLVLVGIVGVAGSRIRRGTVRIIGQALERLVAQAEAVGNQGQMEIRVHRSCNQRKQDELSGQPVSQAVIGIPVVHVGG